MLMVFPAQPVLLLKYAQVHYLGYPSSTAMIYLSRNLGKYCSEYCNQAR